MNELNDKELLEQLTMIKADMENIEIPESVKPLNMMKRIEMIEQEENGCFEGEINNSKGTFFNKIGKTLKGNRFLQSGIAAALVVAICTTAMILNSERSMTSDENMPHIVGQYNAVIKQETESEGDIAVLSGYSKLHNYLVVNKTKEEAYYELSKGWIGSDDFMTNDGEASGSAPELDVKGDYSDTNTRTEGVHEADVIKTDGEYIYYIKKGNEFDGNGVTLAIYKADGKNTSIVSETPFIDEVIKVGGQQDTSKKFGFVENSYELIIYENKLVIITEYNQKTIATFYDISDKGKPKHINVMFVEGEYDSCKVADGHLYIFAKKRIVLDIDKHKDKMSENDAKNLLGIDTSEGIVDSSDIYVASCEDYDTYVVMATVDLSDIEGFKQIKSILGSSMYGTLYMSGEMIYYISQVNTAIDELNNLDDKVESKRLVTKDKSEIISLSYENGIIKPKDLAVIDGYIDDEFDVDEYNGYLRLAVTVVERECVYNKHQVPFYDGKEWVVGDTWLSDDYVSSSKMCSSLYILDGNLEIVGSIQNLKEEEKVYGVRFDGDIGYVVTYRQMDPLFSIDLSDPTKPKVIGELKIPGFSEYLHKWDENTLIGIGYDDDRSIKLSTFDITDKTNVWERDICIIEDVYYTEALYNHKAVLISPERNIIGFDCNYGETYNVYTYVDGRLEQALSEELRFNMNNGYYYINTRGLYIGNYIYIVNEHEGIYIYDINTFEKVAKVR